jgi:hypothetical protein
MEADVSSRRVFHMLSLALALAVGGAVVLIAQDQKPEVIESKSELVRERGAHPNIKSETRVNDPNAQGRPAPPQKGGEKPRGDASVCDVHFDNRTSWWIHVWVDWQYEGAMPGWGDIYTYAIPGPTILYAEARFTDGSVRRWGPINVRCPSYGSYTWRLRP